MASTTCYVRLCRQPVVDEVSPITYLPVCNLHMQAEMVELNTEEIAVAQKIVYFKKYATPLRRMQHRLAFDLQVLDDNFRELRDTLDRCQKELFDAMTAHHDQMMDSLKIVADIDEFEIELRKAKEQNGMKQVHQMNRSMARSLDNQELDSKLVRMDKTTQEVKMAALPDVNTRVRELQTYVERHLAMARNLVEFIDVADVEQTRLQLVKTKTEVEGISKAICMTRCSNTTGFMIDESGSIVKPQGSAAEQKLPQPSIFVAFESDSAPPEFGIKLISAYSDVAAVLACSWEAAWPIRDLHCDNERQLLFVAQNLAITVSDLAGGLHSQIAVSDLEDGNDCAAAELCCITGDPDKLFALAKLTDGRPLVFGLSKESGQVHLRLPMPASCSLTLDSRLRIAARDGMLMIADSASAFTVCTVTGLRTLSESVDCPEIFGDAGSQEDDNEIAVHLLFSDCHPGPRVSTLTTKLTTVCPQIVPIDRSSNHCVFMLLRDGKLFLNNLSICKS